MLRSLRWDRQRRQAKALAKPVGRQKSTVAWPRDASGSGSFCRAARAAAAAPTCGHCCPPSATARPTPSRPRSCASTCAPARTAGPRCAPIALPRARSPRLAPFPLSRGPCWSAPTTPSPASRRDLSGPARRSRIGGHPGGGLGRGTGSRRGGAGKTAGDLRGDGRRNRRLRHRGRGVGTARPHSRRVHSDPAGRPASPPPRGGGGPCPPARTAGTAARAKGRSARRRTGPAPAPAQIEAASTPGGAVEYTPAPTAAPAPEPATEASPPAGSPAGEFGP